MCLGNPGPEYAQTRHNAGFVVADALATHWQFPAFKKPWRWRARVSKGQWNAEDVVIVKPQTFMNRSGQALRPLLEQEAWEPTEHMLVVVDEAALPLGTFRVRGRGSAGGHNGLKSIAGALLSDDFSRLRIGVGPQPDDTDLADFVLDDFSAVEHDELISTVPQIIDAIECWITEGIETAMNRFNRRGTQA